jgi:imidazolonepropionase
MLRAIRAAKEKAEIDIIPTCLAAHIFPKDYKGTITDYLDEIAEKVFPKMKEENLGHRIDAFIEEEAYSKTVISEYFEKAKQHGFDITVHADQFSCSGSEVAIQHGALSADHLEASGKKEILALANSSVVAMALPGASIGIGCDFTPARKLLDAGASLAIASDWNPGSAPMGDLLTQASIIATFEKLSTAEILSGITFRAAAALDLHDRGRLVPGMKSDLTCFSTSDYRDILYHQGQLTPSLVFASGKLIYEKS